MSSTIKKELRRDKTDKEGKAPIRIIYQISGQRVYFSTGQKVKPEHWDNETQQAIYLKKGDLLASEAKEVNDNLGDLIRKIERIEKKFELDGVVYSPDMVKEAFTEKQKPKTKRDASSKELHSFIEKYLQENKHIRVPGSLSVYRQLGRHLAAYEKKHKTTVSFESIDTNFFKSFQNFLVGLTIKRKDGTVARRLNNVTIAKQLSTLKTFLSYARQSGIAINDSYKNFTVKRENDLEVIALTQDEFNTLWKMDLSGNKRLDQVRDCFIFSCVSGFRYSDLAVLRWEHIKHDNIEITQVKTGHKIVVPVNVYSQNILEKYKDQPRPLPIISNQKSNLYLAELCKLAGLDEPVSIIRKYGAERVETIYKKYELIRMHCGRKTFATLSLKKGMTAEQVMKIGGWKDYRSFARYVNLTRQDSQEAMIAVWGAPKSNLKAV
ncbi:MAG: site-specific integrase [Chitinophagaceae bacterium]|nr:site-specific integrase [Chitinophagaceae bacterium]